MHFKEFEVFVVLRPVSAASAGISPLVLFDNIGIFFEPIVYYFYGFVFTYNAGRLIFVIFLNAGNVNFYRSAS